MDTNKTEYLIVREDPSSLRNVLQYVLIAVLNTYSDAKKYVDRNIRGSGETWFILEKRASCVEYAAPVLFKEYTNENIILNL